MNHNYPIRYTRIFILVVICIAAAPFQDAPPVPPVTVPDYLPLLIAAGLGFLFTEGLKALTAALPKIPNLEGQATVIVGALTTIAVAVFNALFAFIPPEYAPLAIGIFGTIGSILGANGIYSVLKRFQPKPPVVPETETVNSR